MGGVIIVSASLGYAWHVGRRSQIPPDPRVQMEQEITDDIRAGRGRFPRIAPADIKPKALDVSLNRPSDQGRYAVSLRAQTATIPVNVMHAWIISVHGEDGKPIEAAKIDMDSMMPEHKHGMATKPRVTRALGNGDYLVEGIKFQMGGWWLLAFDIRDATGGDFVTFNILVP